MKYIISEDRLKELLITELKLQSLEYSGIDSWRLCEENEEEFLLDCINGRVSEEDLPDEIDFEYIAELDLEYYEKF